MIYFFNCRLGIASCKPYFCIIICSRFGVKCVNLWKICKLRVLERKKGNLGVRVNKEPARKPSASCRAVNFSFSFPYNLACVAGVCRGRKRRNQAREHVKEPRGLPRAFFVYSHAFENLPFLRSSSFYIQTSLVIDTSHRRTLTALITVTFCQNWQKKLHFSSGLFCPPRSVSIPKYYARLLWILCQNSPPPKNLGHFQKFCLLVSAVSRGHSDLEPPHFFTSLKSTYPKRIPFPAPKVFADGIFVCIS